ncbi:hypothetical protein VTN00DRAFT_3798 [Thermoascus crustaceus]|uniref:uncharacterized protein n=1 Tax=Thermoascus crustaceus TaxID=5088 RepID=UPI003742D429
MRSLTLEFSSMDRVRGFLLTRPGPSRNDVENQLVLPSPYKSIEDYPAGYPRFSALVGADPSFHVARRFTTLRARLLHLKQDKLSILEKRLDAIDREENAPLFLGSSRRDRNAERQAVLSEIDPALADYDNLLARNAQILQFNNATPRAVMSLRNWINGNACIAREETEFLENDHDLLTLATPEDSTLKDIEDWVEHRLIQYCGGLYKDRCNYLSKDSNVYIPSGSLTVQLARALLGLLVVILLLVPVLACNSLDSGVSRLIVITVSTTAFIAVMSGITRAKSVELFVAGAAYATVLTVFITH